MREEGGGLSGGRGYAPPRSLLPSSARGGAGGAGASGVGGVGGGAPTPSLFSATAATLAAGKQQQQQQPSSSDSQRLPPLGSSSGRLSARQRSGVYARESATTATTTTAPAPLPPHLRRASSNGGFSSYPEDAGPSPVAADQLPMERASSSSSLAAAAAGALARGGSGSGSGGFFSGASAAAGPSSMSRLTAPTAASEQRRQALEEYRRRKQEGGGGQRPAAEARRRASVLPGEAGSGGGGLLFSGTAAAMQAAGRGGAGTSTQPRHPQPRQQQQQAPPPPPVSSRAAAASASRPPSSCSSLGGASAYADASYCWPPDSARSAASAASLPASARTSGWPVSRAPSSLAGGGWGGGGGQQAAAASGAAAAAAAALVPRLALGRLNSDCGAAAANPTTAQQLTPRATAASAAQPSALPAATTPRGEGGGAATPRAAALASARPSALPTPRSTAGQQPSLTPPASARRRQSLGGGGATPRGAAAARTPPPPLHAPPSGGVLGTPRSATTTVAAAGRTTPRSSGGGRATPRGGVLSRTGSLGGGGGGGAASAVAAAPVAAARAAAATTTTTAAQPGPVSRADHERLAAAARDELRLLRARELQLRHLNARTAASNAQRAREAEAALGGAAAAVIALHARVTALRSLLGRAARRAAVGAALAEQLPLLEQWSGGGGAEQQPLGARCAAAAGGAAAALRGALTRVPLVRGATAGGIDGDPDVEALTAALQRAARVLGGLRPALETLLGGGGGGGGEAGGGGRGGAGAGAGAEGLAETAALATELLRLADEEAAILAELQQAADALDALETENASLVAGERDRRWAAARAETKGQAPHSVLKVSPAPDPMSPPRRGHFCVLGASGFYGAQTVVALASLASRYARPDGALGSFREGDGGDATRAARRAQQREAPAFQSPIVIVMAGRNPHKLQAMLPALALQAAKLAKREVSLACRRVQFEVLPVPVDVASPGDGSGLRTLALAAPVLLNCIRPVAYEWSERVMSACARERTAYLDLCARPAFLDAVRELFSVGEDGEDGDDQPPPPPLVPGCGFDYALPDVATWYALRAYARRHGPSRPPASVRATFLVRTPPPPDAPPRAGKKSKKSKGGGGGFKLRLGAVDELLAPPQKKKSSDGNDNGDDGHRGWDPRRADVKAALARAAARRTALEAQGLAAPPPRRAWFVHEEAGLEAGPRWTAPFFVGGGVEADLLRVNLTEGVEEDGGGGRGGGDDGAAAAAASSPAPRLQFDCRVALPAPPSFLAMLFIASTWPLLLAVFVPLLSLIVAGALLARRSPQGGLVRTAYLAVLPYLTLGMVTADDDAARRSADRSVFERVCVVSGSGGGSGGSNGDSNNTAPRPLRVAFRGSFAQSLTPQCIAAAAVCLLNEHVALQRRQRPKAAVSAGTTTTTTTTATPQQRGRASLVLTPAQALMKPPPPGCASFLEMLCARHGLVIEEEEL